MNLGDAINNSKNQEEIKKVFSTILGDDPEPSHREQSTNTNLELKDTNRKTPPEAFKKIDKAFQEFMEQYGRYHQKPTFGQWREFVESKNILSKEDRPILTQFLKDKAGIKTTRAGEVSLNSILGYVARQQGENLAADFPQKRFNEKMTQENDTQPKVPKGYKSYTGTLPKKGLQWSQKNAEKQSAEYVPSSAYETYQKSKEKADDQAAQKLMGALYDASLGVNTDQNESHPQAQEQTTAKTVYDSAQTDLNYINNDADFLRHQRELKLKIQKELQKNKENTSLSQEESLVEGGQEDSQPLDYEQPEWVSAGPGDLDFGGIGSNLSQQEHESKEDVENKKENIPSPSSNLEPRHFRHLEKNTGLVEVPRDDMEEGNTSVQSIDGTGPTYAIGSDKIARVQRVFKDEKGNLLYEGNRDDVEKGFVNVAPAGSNRTYAISKDKLEHVGSVNPHFEENQVQEIDMQEKELAPQTTEDKKIVTENLTTTDTVVVRDAFKAGEKPVMNYRGQEFAIESMSDDGMWVSFGGRRTRVDINDELSGLIQEGRISFTVPQRFEDKNIHERTQALREDFRAKYKEEVQQQGFFHRLKNRIWFGRGEGDKLEQQDMSPKTMEAYQKYRREAGQEKNNYYMHLLKDKEGWSEDRKKEVAERLKNRYVGITAIYDQQRIAREVRSETLRQQRAETWYGKIENTLQAKFAKLEKEDPKKARLIKQGGAWLAVAGMYTTSAALFGLNIPGYLGGFAGGMITRRLASSRFANLVTKNESIKNLIGNESRTQINMNLHDEELIRLQQQKAKQKAQDWALKDREYMARTKEKDYHPDEDMYYKAAVATQKKMKFEEDAQKAEGRSRIEQLSKQFAHKEIDSLTFQREVERIQRGDVRRWRARLILTMLGAMGGGMTAHSLTSSGPDLSRADMRDMRPDFNRPAPIATIDGGTLPEVEVIGHKSITPVDVDPVVSHEAVFQQPPVAEVQVPPQSNPPVVDITPGPSSHHDIPIAEPTQGHTYQPQTIGQNTSGPNFKGSTGDGVHTQSVPELNQDPVSKGDMSRYPQSELDAATPQNIPNTTVIKTGGPLPTNHLDQTQYLHNQGQFYGDQNVAQAGQGYSTYKSPDASAYNHADVNPNTTFKGGRTIPNPNASIKPTITIGVDGPVLQDTQISFGGNPGESTPVADQSGVMVDGPEDIFRRIPGGQQAGRNLGKAMKDIFGGS
ncbi:hypothetical protein H6776_00255 [Candidatus Nomurabacteria bacterium]|nr:hypothetical protein [Candidatus Nomurabacteria bacterium]